MPFTGNWVVVFDIDDTIISEKNYQLSGIKAVEEMISLVIKKDVKGQLIEAYKKGVKDLWDYAIVKFNLSQNSVINAITGCFVPLLNSVLSALSSSARFLAISITATCMPRHIPK